MKLGFSTDRSRTGSGVYSDCGLICLVTILASGSLGAMAQDAPPARTSLSNPEIRYTVPEKGYVVWKRGSVEAVIVDNRAVDDEVLKGHQAGYNGVALLKHERQPRTLFVPTVAGLNFEHIHDGTKQARDIVFEPRHAPMELRRINDFTVELYQAPTPHWGLESCTRYELLDSGVIEMTFECIPRRETFKNGYIGLFWASYIHQPESLDIHYLGRSKDAPADSAPVWIRGVTPAHGVLSTHVAADDRRMFAHDIDFPATLVFNESKSVYVEPWYFGRCRDMAYVQTFRSADGVRLSQSPSGGGKDCPAWDFQWFIPDYKVGQRYQLVMRAAYLPTAGLSDVAIQDKAKLVARAAATGLGNRGATSNNPAKVTTTIDKLKRGEPTRVICLGDSVTGLYYHTGGKRAYTDMLGIALQRAFPNAKVTAINAGISGNTTADGLNRLEQDVLRHQPDLVTVMFGLNDVTRVPPDQYRANLVKIVTRCWEVGAEVLLCTPNDVIDTSSRPISKLTQYCDIIHEVGRTMGVPVADCYAQLEMLRAKDPAGWRLLLSDEIHPNLDGHRRMAETLAQSIKQATVSLEDVEPTPLSWTRIEDSAKANRPIKILAMPPFDAEIEKVLKKRFPNAQIEVVAWKVADQTLVQIEQAAKDRVRAMRPDLVVIAVPRVAKFASPEEFIHSYSWIMNWSLNFGTKDWECVVVHPAVADPEHPDPMWDVVVRKLVRAQDLELIDRQPDDKRSAAEIFGAALEK